MRKSRIEILLVVLTVLALGAGVAAGLLASRLPAARAQSHAQEQSSSDAADATSSLAEELQLTAEQREQMRDIWEGVRREVQAAYERAQRLQKLRDDELAKILNDEQKAKFEKISHDFAERYKELAQERDETFSRAVEQTKQLLNDEQRMKYEQILKRQVGSVGLAGPSSAVSDSTTRVGG